MTRKRARAYETSTNLIYAPTIVVVIADIFDTRLFKFLLMR